MFTNFVLQNFRISSSHECCPCWTMYLMLTFKSKHLGRYKVQAEVLSHGILIIKVNLCGPRKCLRGAFLCGECELACEKECDDTSGFSCYIFGGLFDFVSWSYLRFDQTKTNLEDYLKQQQQLLIP